MIHADVCVLGMISIQLSSQTSINQYVLERGDFTKAFMIAPGLELHMNMAEKCVLNFKSVEAQKKKKNTFQKQFSQQLLREARKNMSGRHGKK